MKYAEIKDTTGDVLYVSIGGGKVWLEPRFTSIIELDSKGRRELIKFLEQA